MTRLLRTIDLADLAGRRRDPVDADTLARAAAILADVDRDGETAVRRWAEDLGDLPAGAPLVIDQHRCRRALETLPGRQREALEACTARVFEFARAQRATQRDLDLSIPGGRAGHTLVPVATAGCYAPGGRYPLPSSVIMTAATARAAGVDTVVVASPRPAPVTLAAAALANADVVLAVGGAQAVAALARGVAGLPACDVVVGPGNRWVTAAKQLVSGRVGIDMLAGPSELLVVAAPSADPDWIAADLLAQAEHDPDAVPLLVTWSTDLAAAVERALGKQLAVLPTADVARAALGNGGVIMVADDGAAAEVSDLIAPEHLQLSVPAPRSFLARCRNYGAAFLGEDSAEVMGDYGAGPNHTLPTGGTARWRGGLSVSTFLQARTWLELDRRAEHYPELLDQSRVLAEMEGLLGHARAATIRR